MAIVKQWLSKHISVVTNKHTTVEGPSKLVFLCCVRQDCIGRTIWQLVVGWLDRQSVNQFTSSCMLVVTLETCGGKEL
jgi:hypothetical protein